MTTCFAVCEGLRRKVETVLLQLRSLPGADGLGPLAAASYPGCCHLAPGALPRLDVSRWLEGPQQTRLHVFGGGCLCGCPLEIAGPPGYELHDPESCAQMLVGQELAGWLARHGARLLAPGCLAAWRAYLAAWGPDQARAFFAEAASSFVLLDTGVDPAAEAALGEFAVFVGRPCEAVPVGLGPLQATLQAILLRDQLAHAAEMRG